MRLWLLICAVLISCMEPDQQEFHWRRVVKITDGDTIQLEAENGGKPERVRLIGIDAPETRNTGKKQKHPLGAKSREYLDYLLSERVVRLEYDVVKTDKYGRTLAYVYLKDGTFVNAKMVEEGYAQVVTYPPNVRYADLFLELQRKAREANKGLWAETY